LAKFKGKDRAEALRARVNAYVQEHSERLRPLAERRLRDMDELVGRAHRAQACREAYARRCCILPVDGFFEWKAIKGGRPSNRFATAMRDGSPFGIAGFWENWKDQAGEWRRTFADYRAVQRTRRPNP
jgi:SOS response associated peptidase (SRAP)